MCVGRRANCIERFSASLPLGTNAFWLCHGGGEGSPVGDMTVDPGGGSIPKASASIWRERIEGFRRGGVPAGGRKGN